MPHLLLLRANMFSGGQKQSSSHSSCQIHKRGLLHSGQSTVLGNIILIFVILAVTLNFLCEVISEQQILSGTVRIGWSVEFSFNLNFRKYL